MFSRRNSIYKKITIDTSTFNELTKYYDEILNTDKSTYKSSNDEPTPIDCINEMNSIMLKQRNIQCISFIIQYFQKCKKY